jgi:hypothetical protein
MKTSFVLGMVGLSFTLCAPTAIAQEAHDHHAHESAVGVARHGTADEEEAATIEANLGAMSPQDRELAAAQRNCVVMIDMPLGAMGLPSKVTVNGEAVFVCCKGCEKKAPANPAKTLAMAKKLRDAVQQEIEIAANMAKLSPADRELAAAQGFCAVMVDNRLGTMGPPLKISVGSEVVFLCCEGCEA